MSELSATGAARSSPYVLIGIQSKRFHECVCGLVLQTIELLVRPSSSTGLGRPDNQAVVTVCTSAYVLPGLRKA